MMKLLYLSLFIILINTPENCTCNYNIASDFNTFETVFKARIIETSSSFKKGFNKTAKLEILKVYKGKPDNKIASKLGGCSTPILSKNKSWIFFTNKENNIQVLGSCNPSIKLYPSKLKAKNPKSLKHWKERLDRNLNILDSLSKNKKILSN